MARGPLIGPPATFRDYVQTNKKIANFSYKLAIFPGKLVG